MPIRSQIDTGVYGGSRDTSSFGDIMNLVSGVAGMVRSSRESKKKDQEDDDLRYINEVTGKYMQGYQGNDPNDLQQRRQGALNEILTNRPELNQYTQPLQDQYAKDRFTADDNALKLQQGQVTLDNDREVLKQNQRLNLDAETKKKLERSMEAAQRLSDVSDEFGYRKTLDEYNDVLGSITPTYEQYSVSNDPATVFWRNQAGQIKQKKLAQAERDIEDRDLLVREKEAGIDKTGAETKYKGAQSADLYSQIKKRQWDMDNPKNDPSKNKFGSLAGFNAPEALSYAGMAMGQFSKMKQLIDSGDAKFYERGTLGSFTNPEFKKTLDFLSNYIGRQDSGAAINKDEWRTFKNLIADRNLMMTPEGRQQVSNLLGEYIGRTYNMGVFQTKGNENWYEDYKAMSETAKREYGGSGPATKGPKPGDMEDGYVFRGGNPADPKNWELVK